MGAESAEFGDNLETIKNYAFHHCTALKHLKLPSVIAIKTGTFWHCKAMTNIEFSEHLDEIDEAYMYIL